MFCGNKRKMAAVAKDKVITISVNKKSKIHVYLFKQHKKYNVDLSKIKKLLTLTELKHKVLRKLKNKPFLTGKNEKQHCKIRKIVSWQFFHKFIY